jgi:hypothetical protein
MISSASITVDKRWAMTSVVRPFETDPYQRLLDFLLGGRIERRCGLVEDQDGRCLENGAGDGHALLLAARQFQPALADHGIETFRQRRMKSPIWASSAACSTSASPASGSGHSGCCSGWCR